MTDGTELLAPPGSRMQRRGRPPDGFWRAAEITNGVFTIMYERGVGTTAAVRAYHVEARMSEDHIWRAMRRYWRETES